MRRALGFFLCVIVVVGFIAGVNVYLSYNYARITSLDFKAVIYDDSVYKKGSARITERMTYEMRGGAHNDFYWVLWRGLPSELYDGMRASYTINSVKMIESDGSEIVFEEAARAYIEDRDYVSSMDGLGSNRWYYDWYDQCILFYLDGKVRDSITIEFEYFVTNASIRYGDCSQLTLLLFDGKETKYLREVNAQILIPEDKTPREGNYRAFTYGTIAHTFPFTKSDTANAGYTTFMFSLDSAALRFKPYNRHIEFALVSFGEDAHIFTQYASSNHYYDYYLLDDLIAEHEDYLALPQKYKSIKSAVLVLLIGFGLISWLGVFVATKVLQSRYDFYKPERKYEIYQNVPEDLDVTFAGVFVHCKHSLVHGTRGAYPAGMLGLVKKGYIKITKYAEHLGYTDSNTMIAIDSPSTSVALSQTENLLYGLIKRHTIASGTSLRDFKSHVTRDCDNTATFSERTENIVGEIGVNKGYFQEKNYDKVQKKALKAVAYTVIAALAVMALNGASYFSRLDFVFGGLFALGAMLLVAAGLIWKNFCRFALLTQEGENQYAKWRGFYNFLKNRTSVKHGTHSEIANYDECLIYATAFGLSSKVIKSLAINLPKVDGDMFDGDMYADEGSMLYRSNYFYMPSFRYTYGTRFRSTVRHASFVSRGHSGGVFGGGGRGGGGGG